MNPFYYKDFQDTMTETQQQLQAPDLSFEDRKALALTRCGRLKDEPVCKNPSLLTPHASCECSFNIQPHDPARCIGGIVKTL
jgi:hypothetical protein